MAISPQLIHNLNIYAVSEIPGDDNLCHGGVLNFLKAQLATLASLNSLNSGPSGKWEMCAVSSSHIR